MDNSLKTGKYVKIILEASNSLTRIVPKNKINNLMFDPTEYPYIVISRANLTPQYNKDIGLTNNRGHDNTVQVNIICHASTYEQSIDIATEVRNAVEGKGYKNSEIYIDRFQLMSAAETTNGTDDFAQILTFQATVK